MHEDFRNRLREQLERRKVNAYISLTPANLFYTTGYLSPLLGTSLFWMGTEIAIIPVDSTKTPAMVVSDFMAKSAQATADIKDVRTFAMWVENRDIDVLTGKSLNYKGPAHPTRPSQYDKSELHTLIRGILRDRDLGSITIGADLKHINGETLKLLEEFNPDCTFVDVTDLMYELRMVKYPHEIEILRKAVNLFEAGVKYAISEIHEGQSPDEIRYNYQRGVLNTLLENRELGQCKEAWAWINVGSGDSSGVAQGDLIKIDSGVVLDGYYSDCARTFCFGKPNKEQLEVYNTLLSAHAPVRKIMKPGVEISSIYKIATEEIRKNGLTNYTRGHFGHSIGMDNAVEEPPFISADEHRVLKSGMVLCFETPYYSNSLGAFGIEDMIVITEDGSENLTTLSHDLVELSNYG